MPPCSSSRPLSEPEASEPSTVVHSHLLKTGLLPYLRAEELFFSSAGTPPILPALSNLLHGTSPKVDANPLRWNAMLSALSHRGFPSLALWAFSVMHKLGLSLCSYSLCSALAASSAERAVRMGKQIHAYAAKSCWVSAVFVGGALVNLYVKSGAVVDARYAFDEIQLKNTMCVNTLLMGYVEAKLWSDGVMLVKGMPGFGLTPDGFTTSTLLRMCAEVPAAGLGMQVHAYLMRRTKYLEEDVFVQSSLMEMYGKCGLVNEAQLVFDLAGNIMPGKRRDVVLWTSMLNAFGRNGRFNKVVDTFDEMLHAGVKPDEVAFVAVLAACSRTGDVSRALDYFKFMSSEHQILPCQEHYSCVIDLLCKAGQLEKAWKFANEMNVGEEGDGRATSVRIWGTLLSACKEFSNVEMGKLAAQRALGLDPSNMGIYMELSNLYARMGMWNEIEHLRELLSKRGLKKDVGFSRIELTR
ncbi:hypothetical protein Taro_003149 [Colocasia esculenta]|uniref:Pentatricopeptide repeat-containing protein n=1 Tax=Colocasia esculenta TaxID=4460 RepID=A0A843TN78_COLES|nr:hypothetical protein [Colocasia esculenta]